MTKTPKHWFEVDTEGLASLLGARSKEFALYELVQNAWDTSATHVVITLTAPDAEGHSRFSVEDDSVEGFRDLSDAFTLFAPSAKRRNPAQRGRFNLGEKLAFGVSASACVETTSGTVGFTERGRRVSSKRRDKGTRVSGRLPMSATEFKVCERALKVLLPPAGKATIVNSEPLEVRNPLRVVTRSLPTEMDGDDGVLRRRSRETTIEILETAPGERATLYELGIPVVETGDRYHVNIGQKIPLTLDRANVPPAYLARVRAIVTEAMASDLDTEDANSVWVREALEKHGDSLHAETVNHLVELRFGKRRVAYDPSDLEANSLAVSRGYTVVHGGELSGAEWAAVKRAKAIRPAGQVTPSPKPFSPDGAPLTMLPRSKWTAGMEWVAEYAHRVAGKLVDEALVVEIANDSHWPYRAVYSRGRVIFNAGRLGYRWFDGGVEPVNELLLHELAHHFEADHLSARYHEALCQLGAKLATLALEEPDLMRRVQIREAEYTDAV